MKREKRHGIERELSIKRIRSQKKYSILIVSVLLLTCTLIQIGFQMSEGLKAAYIENMGSGNRYFWIWMKAR